MPTNSPRLKRLSPWIEQRQSIARHRGPHAKILSFPAALRQPLGPVAALIATSAARERASRGEAPNWSPSPAARVGRHCGPAPGGRLRGEPSEGSGIRIGLSPPSSSKKEFDAPTSCCRRRLGRSRMGEAGHRDRSNRGVSLCETCRELSERASRHGQRSDKYR